MSVRRTRAEQVEVNAVRLLDAAHRMFVRDGFHATSLDKVARAAGLTKGAVYARFASKGDLMIALLERRVDDRLAEMTATLGREPVPADAARALARQFASLVEADPSWSLLVLEFRCHAARNRALNAKFARLHARLRVGMAEALRARGIVAATAERRDAEDFARMAFVLSNGFALERAVEGDEFPSVLYERASALLAGERRRPAGGSTRRRTS